MKNPLSKLLLIMAAIVLVLCSVTPSIAGEKSDEIDLWTGVAEEIDDAPGYEDPQSRKRDWALSLGLISGLAPDYEGSNDYKFSYGPNIAASWRDTVFYKGKTLGVNLIRNKKFKAGLNLSLTSGRDEDDNDKLEGLGDVDGSTEVGGFVSYRKDSYRLRAEIRQDVDSGHEGALVELTGGTALPFVNQKLLVALGMTWASDDYMESFFGVDSQQSVNSGLRQYKADAGIKDVKVKMTAGYKITNRWRTGAIIEFKRLVGDAADSPIVDDKNQFLAGISLSYHMGSKVLPEDLE